MLLRKTWAFSDVIIQNVISNSNWTVMFWFMPTGVLHHSPLHWVFVILAWPFCIFLMFYMSRIIFNTSIAWDLSPVLTFHISGNFQITKFCIFSDLTRSATFKPLFSEILNSLYSILENTFNGPKYFNASATWVKWLDFIKAVWNLRYQFDCLRNTIWWSLSGKSSLSCQPTLCPINHHADLVFVCHDLSEWPKNLITCLWQSPSSQKPKFEAQFWPETEENYEDIPSNRGKRNPQFSRNNFKTPFNLQEILDNNFNSETWNGTWVSDTQYVYRDVDESLIMVSAGGGGGRVIVPGNIMRDPRVFRFKLSPDQKYVMLAFRPQR